MKKLSKTFWIMLVITLCTSLVGCNIDNAVNVNTYPPSSAKTTVNLAAISKADVTADGELVVADGTILTGTLDGETQKVKIAIAKGATVTLSNATINGVHTDDEHELWAGISCLGDATIILEGSNTVVGFNRFYPGIQPGPKGTTLTIQGNGSLTAKGLYFGAGIGTNDEGSCGNINITGGIITAEGSAGIGAASCGTCGDITISGSAQVTATGREDGAGIGAGDGEIFPSQCGDITISGSAQVTATSNGGGAGIGTGRASTCGNISISGSAQVTAKGGDDSAGIGCGFSIITPAKCGNITITGGTVFAQGKGYATGIGCGHEQSQCGDITFDRGEGFVSVTAIRGGNGKDSTWSIGTPSGNYDGTHLCGKIMIFIAELFNGVYALDDNPEGDFGKLYLTISTTDDGDDNTEDTNNTWTLTPTY